MQEDKQELTPEQKASQDKVYEKGGSYEELIRSKGWEHIKVYYEQKLRLFVNDVFLHPEKPLSDYEGQRSELLGLRGLFSEVEYSIKALEMERQKGKDEKAA